MEIGSNAWILNSIYKSTIYGYLKYRTTISSLVYLLNLLIIISFMNYNTKLIYVIFPDCQIFKLQKVTIGMIGEFSY